MEKLGDLYPKMGTHIRFEVNAGTFIQGRTYIIGGFGYSKKNEEGHRREFWELFDKFNTQEKPKIVWKSELNRLFDEGKIIETLNKTL